MIGGGEVWHRLNPKLKNQLVEPDSLSAAGGHRSMDAWKTLLSSSVHQMKHDRTQCVAAGMKRANLSAWNTFIIFCTLNYSFQLIVSPKRNIYTIPFSRVEYRLSRSPDQLHTGEI